jgi:hypothetical protein
LALSPGPFFDKMLRWASAFLIGFDRFCIAFDRILTPSDAPLSGFDHLMLYTKVYPIGIVRIPAAFSGRPKNRRDDYNVGKVGGLSKVAPAEFFVGATLKWVPNAVVCTGRPTWRPSRKRPWHRNVGRDNDPAFIIVLSRDVFPATVLRTRRAELPPLKH